MNQRDFIDKIRAEAASLSCAQGLYLVGSFGRGTEDAFSDIDLVAVVAQENHEETAKEWNALVKALDEIIYIKTHRFGATLINAITAHWLRIDLIIETPEAFLKRAQAYVRTLFERESLVKALQESLPKPQVDKEQLSGIVDEFIRMLGLGMVGAGRNEVFLLQTGTGMMRDLIAKFLIAAKALPDPGGMLHPSKILDEEEMGFLQSLPLGGRSVSAQLEEQHLIARAFFPRAKRVCETYGIDWPDAFLSATEAHLGVSLMDEFPMGARSKAK